MKSNRFELITTSQLVYREGLLLKGFLFTASAALGEINIYDGQDVTSGRRVCQYEAVGQGSYAVLFGEGLRLERGLYITLDRAATEVTVWFDPWETESELEE